MAQERGGLSLKGEDKVLSLESLKKKWKAKTPNCPWEKCSPWNTFLIKLKKCKKKQKIKNKKAKKNKTKRFCKAQNQNNTFKISLLLGKKLLIYIFKFYITFFFL